MENIFYVYAYLDPRKPGKYKYNEFEFDYEPFYVGKGKEDRLNDHLDETLLTTTNAIKTGKILKIKRETGNNPIIFKVAKELNNSEANILEIKLINLIGKSIDNIGPLTNIMSGGIGGYNINVVNSNRLKRKGKTWEEIYGVEGANNLRIYFSSKMKGNTFRNKNGPWNKGKTGYKIKGRDEESKKRTSEALKNSDKHKAAMASKEVRDKISNTCRELTTEYWKDKKYKDKVLESRRQYHEENPKIKIDDLIEQLSIVKTKKELCKHFDVAYSTLDKYLEKYNLKFK